MIGEKLLIPEKNNPTVYFLCARGCGKNLRTLEYLLSLPPNTKFIDASKLIIERGNNNANKSKVFFRQDR